MSLRCQGIFKSFERALVLDNVSIEFPASGAVALMGPNGAGKTTLINVITGFVKPDAGRCTLGSEDITRLPSHQITRLGIARTFQDNRLIGGATALDNLLLAMPRQRHESLLMSLLQSGLLAEEERARENAEELLRLVGLSEAAGSLAKALSYGQQKLLSLAACLATGARVIILDEPLAGIHAILIEQVMGLVRKLTEEEKLIIFVEHNVEAVRNFADELIVMDSGRVIAKGPPQSVLDMPEVLEAYID